MSDERETRDLVVKLDANMQTVMGRMDRIEEQLTALAEQRTAWQTELRQIMQALDDRWLERCKSDTAAQCTKIGVAETAARDAVLQVATLKSEVWTLKWLAGIAGSFGLLAFGAWITALLRQVGGQ